MIKPEVLKRSVIKNSGGAIIRNLRMPFGWEGRREVGRGGWDRRRKGGWDIRREGGGQGVAFTPVIHTAWGVNYHSCF